MNIIWHSSNEKIQYKKMCRVRQNVRYVTAIGRYFLSTKGRTAGTLGLRFVQKRWIKIFQVYRENHVKYDILGKNLRLIFIIFSYYSIASLIFLWSCFVLMAKCYIPVQVQEQV